MPKPLGLSALEVLLDSLQGLEEGGRGWGVFWVGWSRYRRACLGRRAALLWAGECMSRRDAHAGRHRVGDEEPMVVHRRVL